MTIPPAHLVHAHGMAMPALGLGTYRANGAECVEAVRTAIAVGYRHIDTARMYDNEVEVGEGIRASGIRREELFVTTKVWWTDIAEGDLQRAAEASLKRLDLAYVDLLLIHWPNPAVPVSDSIKALCAMKARGLAKHIGMSNFTVALLAEAHRHATEPLASLQAEYHPTLDQSKLRAAAASYGMAWTSYCPIGKGAEFDLPTIQEISARHGKTPAQIILRWQIQQPGTAAIPKSANPGRIAENLAVFDFALSDAEMAQISALARPGSRIVSPAFAPAWD
jgi:diketogulonate reductase-like aldo/keto reductase